MQIISRIACHLCILCALIPASCGNGSDRFVIDLQDQWKMMLGDDPEYARPDPIDSGWPVVTLPSRHLLPADLISISGAFTEEERSAKKGFVWYRRTFTLDQLPEKNLLFQAGEIMNAESVFINGVHIGTTGRFPPEFRSGWSRFRSYEIPKVALKQGENIIAMRVYFDAEAWIMGPLRIIDYDSGISVKMRQDLLQVYGMQTLSFTLLGLALFFFYIYIRRRKELLYLYFTLCCLCLATTMALCFIENLYPDIRISSNIILKITQLGLLLFPPFLALFYRSYCGASITRARLAFYLALPLSGCILILAATERADILFIRNIYLITIPPYMIDMIIQSVKQLARRNRSGLLMFLGLAPTLILGAVDILAFTFGLVDSSMALFLYGVPALIFIIAVHLVNRFVTSLNQMEKLNRALRESLVENMRLAALEKELDIARKIQMSTLPGKLPDSRLFDIAVRHVPTEKIGGDYYSFHMPREGLLGVLISDVSGHGVPAALISSMVKVLADMLSHLSSQPHLLITEMNRKLMGNIEKQFLTTGYAFIDHENRRLLFARAGHLPLMIIRKDSMEVEELLPKGRAIGWDASSEYHLSSIDIAPGDRVVLYTDCAIEAVNRRGEMFGEERFKSIFLRENRPDASATMEIIYRELHEWSSGVLEDDLTLIIIDIL